MAAELRGRRGRRRKETEENTSRTKSRCSRTKRWRQRGKREGRVTKDQRADQGLKRSPSNLLSAPRVDTGLCLRIWKGQGSRRPLSVLLIHYLICPLWWQITTCDNTSEKPESSVEVRPHSCYFLTSSYTSLPVQNSHTTESNLGQGVVSFSDWIVCWHFTQCEPCQGCVCVCVSRCVLLILSSWSDWFPGHVLSIRMSGVIDLNVCVCVCLVFLHFSVLRQHNCVESLFFRDSVCSKLPTSHQGSGVERTVTCGHADVFVC